MASYYDVPQVPSPGLMGLPHYRSSRISRELHEPVYLNLFTITIQLPKAITDLLGTAATDDVNLLLEEVKKIDGLDTQKVPGTVEQKYKFASRRFANSGPTETTIDLKLDFEVNMRNCETGAPNMYVLRILRMWDDLIYDPLTGTQGLKIEYVAPRMEIIMHDKKGNPFWVWNCYNVWPSAKLTPPNIDYNSKEVYRVSGYQLSCDFWDEAML